MLASEVVPDDGDEIFLEALPRVAVQPVAKLTVVVHFAPAVTTPFAASHVDHEITVRLVVVETSVVGVGAVAAGSGREAVNHALRQEASVLSDPRVALVHGLEGVLLLVLPGHVLLLVEHRIPPNVQQTLRPGAAADEKGAQVEARAILREQQVDRVGVSVADGTARFFVEIRVGKRVGNVERVVVVDVAVRVLIEGVENVVLQRVRGLHDNGVEIEPPEPIEIELAAAAGIWKAGRDAPLSIRVFTHGAAQKVNLFPAFSPFVCISLLSAHVHNFEIIAPAGDVFALVSYAVSFNGPFASSLPLHNAAADVGGEDNDKLGTAAAP